MRKAALTIMIVGCALAGLVLVLRARFQPRLELLTYLPDAEGLRRGAPVRLNGLDAGKVSEIKLVPGHRTSPVEVKMSISPGYRLSIPTDAKVRLSTAGVLGETYVLINNGGTSGSPVMNHAVLEREKGPQLSYDDILKKLMSGVKQVNCDELSKEKTGATDKKSQPVQHQAPKTDHGH